MCFGWEKETTKVKTGEEKETRNLGRSFCPLGLWGEFAEFNGLKALREEILAGWLLSRTPYMPNTNKMERWEQTSRKSNSAGGKPPFTKLFGKHAHLRFCWDWHQCRIVTWNIKLQTEVRCKVLSATRLWLSLFCFLLLLYISQLYNTQVCKTSLQYHILHYIIHNDL